MSENIFMTWAFPPAFSRAAKAADMVSGEPEILQSVSLLLSTAPGERYLVPDYGFDWADLLFEPVNGSSNSIWNPTYLLQRLRDILAIFEPRVELTEVRVSPEPYEGRAVVEMDMIVKESGRALHYSQTVAV